MTTQALFRDDAYLATCEATVTAIHEDGAIELDRTVFYPMGGGQPGDSGFLERQDGSRVTISDTRYGPDRESLHHLPSAGDARGLSPGEAVVCHIDWRRRYRLMRMHTACHLLSVAAPFPITGASVGEDSSRIDLDMPEAIDKDVLAGEVNAMIAANHPISLLWITDADLDADPALVKSKNVRPPRGSGHIRLVVIGAHGAVDSQPCGGTHVGTTAEIGGIVITRIEKKGRENRRIRFQLVDEGDVA